MAAVSAVGVARLASGLSVSLEVTDVTFRGLDGEVGFTFPINQILDVQRVGREIAFRVYPEEVLSLEAATRDDANTLLAIAGRSSAVRDKANAYAVKIDVLDNRNVQIGLLILVVGLIITGVSYSSADPGDSYVVLTGALFWGTIQFIRGVVETFKQ